MISEERQGNRLMHAKMEIKALNIKLAQQKDLIERLTVMNAKAQHDKRENYRIADQAFKLLGQIKGDV
jgi:hypothetical protein